MAVIQNTWVEKQKNKKNQETAPAFETNSKDTWCPVSNKKQIERFTNAARGVFIRTLRGVRK